MPQRECCGIGVDPGVRWRRISSGLFRQHPVAQVRRSSGSSPPTGAASPAGFAG
jgi:hypothetical protein